MDSKKTTWRKGKTWLEVFGKATGKLTAFPLGGEPLPEELLAQAAWVAARLCALGYTTLQASSACELEKHGIEAYDHALVCRHHRRRKAPRGYSSLPRFSPQSYRTGLKITPDEATVARLGGVGHGVGESSLSLRDPQLERILADFFNKLQCAGYSALVIFNAREGRKVGPHLFDRPLRIAFRRSPVKAV